MHRAVMQYTDRYYASAHRRYLALREINASQGKAAFGDTVQAPVGVACSCLSKRCPMMRLEISLGEADSRGCQDRAGSADARRCAGASADRARRFERRNQRAGDHSDARQAAERIGKLSVRGRGPTCQSERVVRIRHSRAAARLASTSIHSRPAWSNGPTASNKRQH